MRNVKLNHIVKVFNLDRILYTLACYIYTFNFPELKPFIQKQLESFHKKKSWNMCVILFIKIKQKKCITISPEFKTVL